MLGSWRCFQRLKDTNLKANHNYLGYKRFLLSGCFQRLKDTNLKANHNHSLLNTKTSIAVFNDSKILI